MDFALCVLWSTAIFDTFGINDFLSNEEDDLKGSIDLLDENNFFLFLCFFHSLATFGMISVSVSSVFVRVQYGLSSEDRDDSDGGSGKKSGKSRGFFSLEMTSDCSFRYSLINSAIGWTNREDANARLGNASTNVGNGV